MNPARTFALSAALLIAAAFAARAEDAKPPPCEPQPTCEFSKLIIKPGAPTPGVKPQDDVPRGIDYQGKITPDIRGSYRLPMDGGSGSAMMR